jgi:hypothetical protein
VIQQTDFLADLLVSRPLHNIQVKKEGGGEKCKDCWNNERNTRLNDEMEVLRRIEEEEEDEEVVMLMLMERRRKCTSLEMNSLNL